MMHRKYRLINHVPKPTMSSVLFLTSLHLTCQARRQEIHGEFQIVFSRKERHVEKHEILLVKADGHTYFARCNTLQYSLADARQNNRPIRKPATQNVTGQVIFRQLRFLVFVY